MTPAVPTVPRLPIPWHWIIVICLAAELLRVSAALWIEQRNRARSVEYEFADSELYRKLAIQIAAGEPYNDGKRHVLRTPGYPAFLAACVKLFGPGTAGTRHAQAGLGAIGCAALYFLVRRLIGSNAGLVAAALAAIYPFAVFLSATLLSESIFGVALVVQLLIYSRLFRSSALHERKSGAGRDAEPNGNRDEDLDRAATAGWAALCGCSAALLTLIRPSWILVVPIVAAGYLGHGFWNRWRRTGYGWQRPMVIAVAMTAGFLAGMAPWWFRNWRVTGHFVSTTLWVGASLYDGLNERATGASDMEFMNRPADWGLDASLVSMEEWEQDQYLRGEAWRFVHDHPARTVRLAGTKFLRFWNPLPNAAEWRSGAFRWISLASTGPVLVLAVFGAYRLRRQVAVLGILAGPVLYFSLIHLIFVSSIRYREAAMLPVLGLVAAALAPDRKRGV